jgi:SAM-dependent methyltransferase
MTATPIYHSYAAVYDVMGHGDFGARMAVWALGWLADRGAPPRRVLDLACGAGAAALVFAASGCDITGVDQSAAMLEIARGKARDAGASAVFLEGDIRFLEPRTEDQEPADDSIGSRFSALGSRFDLATCFSDSLNYLTADGDLDRVFAGVAAALAPGGRLMFDINTEAGLATWEERDVVTHDGRDLMVYNRLSYDPEARLATGRIVWFVREIERWWRGEETHVERAWSDAEICAALARAGLALVARLDVLGNPAADDAERVVYVAQLSGWN